MTDQPVEIRIDKDVYQAAMRRAKAMGLHLASVGKSVLYHEADKARPVAELPEGRPPLREYGVTRTPLRFKLPAEPYAQASKAIQSSGRTIASAVEDGLREFAKTGQLPPTPLPPLSEPEAKVYSGTIKDQILAALADHPDGLSDEQLLAALSGATTSALVRRRELTRDGKIVKAREENRVGIFKIKENA